MRSTATSITCTAHFETIKCSNEFVFFYFTLAHFQPMQRLTFVRTWNKSQKGLLTLNISSMHNNIGVTYKPCWMGVQWKKCHRVEWNWPIAQWFYWQYALHLNAFHCIYADFLNTFRSNAKWCRCKCTRYLSKNVWFLNIVSFFEIGNLRSSL